MHRYASMMGADVHVNLCLSFIHPLFVFGLVWSVLRPYRWGDICNFAVVDVWTTCRSRPTNTLLQRASSLTKPPSARRRYNIAKHILVVFCVPFDTLARSLSSTFFLFFFEVPDYERDG